MASRKSENRRWLDDPQNVTRIFHVLIAVCVLLVAADLFYAKHAEIAIGEWFGFDGFFGFASCLFLVLAAKQLRRLLRRDEDYYD